MTPTAYTLRMSMECPHCRSGLAINAFTHELLCDNCLKTVELSEEWWKEHIDAETVAEAMQQESGNANSISFLGGDNLKLDMGNRPPRCQNCKTDFTTEQMQGAVSAGFFLCPGCQDRIRVRPATPLVLSLIPDAGLCVHEDETGENLETDGHAAAEPVLFACLGCGGGLKVDGSSRLVKCTHCLNDNYLPDALWLRLHPVKVRHAFFVTRNVPEKPKEVTVDNLPVHMTEETALRLLKDETLKPEVLHHIYKQLTDEDDVLIALAKHPNADDELLKNLSDTDHYYQVRVAVAKRPKLSNAVLENLVHDSDSDVKEALARRSDIYSLPQTLQEDILRSMDLDELSKSITDPRFPEWKLYELSDNCTPEDAGRILRAPNVSLRVLRRLGSNPTSRPRIKEHKLYKALPWWKKLFFVWEGF